MNSRPGRLTGGTIRTVPEHKVDGMLRALKISQGKRFRVRSVRYRITGFRDPDSAAWVSRDPRNGHYYRVSAGRHRTRLKPTADIIRASDMLALEVEVTRDKSRIYYVSVDGLG